MLDVLRRLLLEWSQRAAALTARLHASGHEPKPTLTELFAALDGHPEVWTVGPDIYVHTRHLPVPHTELEELAERTHVAVARCAHQALIGGEVLRITHGLSVKMTVEPGAPLQVG